MRPCFQINSKKLEKELLFRDEEDYIYGMNTIALMLLQFPLARLKDLLYYTGYTHLYFAPFSVQNYANPP